MELQSKDKEQSRLFQVLARRSLTVKIPRSLAIDSIKTPELSAAPPDSARIMCAICSANTTSAGRVWVLIDTKLQMVPQAKKRASSFPSKSATLSSNWLTVGSSPFCSSPTGQLWRSPVASLVSALFQYRLSSKIISTPISRYIVVLAVASIRDAHLVESAEGAFFVFHMSENLYQ